MSYDLDDPLAQQQFFGARRHRLLDEAIPNEQAVKIKALYTGDDPLMFQLGQVQNQLPDSPLDLRGQSGNTVLPPLGVSLQKIRRPDRLAKIHQGVAAINFLGRKGQTHGNDLEPEPPAVPMLQFQRHPGRARFDLFQLRIVIRNAFGKNADCLTALQHAKAGFKGLRDCVHGSRVILHPIDRNDTALRQQPFRRLKSEELHRGDKIHLAWHGRPNHK